MPKVDTFAFRTMFHNLGRNRAILMSGVISFFVGILVKHGSQKTKVSLRREFFLIARRFLKMRYIEARSKTATLGS